MHAVLCKDRSATKILKAPTIKARKGSNHHVAGSATSKTVAINNENERTIPMKEQNPSKCNDGEFNLVEKWSLNTVKIPKIIIDTKDSPMRRVT